MKILFISAATAPDYQCDMLFHGLRLLEGPNVVDVSRLWYMYRDEFENGGKDKKNLYGRGFSLYGLLGQDDEVDRSEIDQKIRKKYYDIIIFGSIVRSRAMIMQVLENYSANQIVFVDGEDSQSIFGPVLGRGIYFKRELIVESSYIYPIQFAIPDEKINTLKKEKTKTMAFIDPRDRRTYIYDNEEEYYGDYSESLFAITTQKAGWDCLRHYEIMANNCIPCFIDVEKCPAMTMVMLPKLEIWLAKQLLIEKGFSFFETVDGRAQWSNLNQIINSSFVTNCTTVGLAKYLLGIISNLQ